MPASRDTEPAATSLGGQASNTSDGSHMASKPAPSVRTYNIKYEFKTLGGTSGYEASVQYPDEDNTLDRDMPEFQDIMDRVCLATKQVNVAGGVWSFWREPVAKSTFESCMSEWQETQNSRMSRQGQNKVLEVTGMEDLDNKGSGFRAVLKVTSLAYST